jgi:hypothetical protein
MGDSAEFRKGARQHAEAQAGKPEILIEGSLLLMRRFPAGRRQRVRPG